LQKYRADIAHGSLIQVSMIKFMPKTKMPQKNKKLKVEIYVHCAIYILMVHLSSSKLKEVGQK